MASENTTKKNPTIAKNPSVNQMTLHIGNRYFCAICQDEGKPKDDWGEPAHICHHCGRSFCAECSPALSSFWHLFFQHQELKSMSGRGRRALPGQRRLEPSHCDECIHYAPRMIPWAVLGAGIFAFSYLLLLFVPGLSTYPLGLAMSFLWVLWMVWGMIWRSVDSWFRQQPYFAVDGGKPLLFLQEFLQADGVLDGEYKETFHEGTPYGKLVANVPLDMSMIEELERFASTHHLNDNELAKTKAVAGSIVMENVKSVLNSDQVWPTTGARRWELAAPLPEWPFLWDMNPDAAEQKVGPFEYNILWRFWQPFPVQVQAHFPLRSDRRTLEIQFTLAGNGIAWQPTLLKLVMKPGEKLPPFKLLQVQGRAILNEETNETEVNELSFKNNMARVQLRFEEPPAEGDAPLWITGAVKLLVPGKTISGAKIAAYYNAFGNRVDKPRTKVLCWIDLNFKINVAKVPYQRLSEGVNNFVLDYANAERDDVLIKALGTDTQLIQVHERVHRTQLLTYGVNSLPPTRELVGRWPVEQDDDMLPVVYQLYLMPKENQTQVQIRVEAPVHNEELYHSQAQEYIKRLERIIKRADKEFWASNSAPPPPSGGATGSGRSSSYPGSRAGLLGKIGRKS